MLFNCKATQEVVFLHVQHILPKGNAGGYYLRDAALYKFLGKFRVLKLVTDSHFVACAHQFCEVVFKGVVRETGHGNRTFFPIGFLGLNKPQNLYGGDCIV